MWNTFNLFFFLSKFYHSHKTLLTKLNLHILIFNLFYNFNLKNLKKKIFNFEYLKLKFTFLHILIMYNGFGNFSK